MRANHNWSKVDTCSRGERKKREKVIKAIQPVHSKGDQPWVFFGRNDPKAETPVLWPPHAKSWLIGKDSDVGRDWGQEEKGTTEDEMAGASPTQWTWVWVNSRSWWWTGRPGVLRFMGSQRVGHDWVTELNWTESIQNKHMPDVMLGILLQLFTQLTFYFEKLFFSFHIWYYTYFNAILPNHPTLSLSNRVQKTVLYISVSFAVSYTGLLLSSF